MKSLLWGRFTFKRLLLSIVEIYLGVALLAWLLADGVIHHPPRPHRNEHLRGEIIIQAADGQNLSAVWMPNPKAKYTILFSHGNAEDLDHDLPFLQELWSADFNVLAYDYRGYGRSSGKPSEFGLYRDIDAAYAYLIATCGIPPEQILILGRSLGSGPSTYLASTKAVGGLILESAFTSAFRVAVPFPLFPFDQFPNLERLARIRCPMLVFHGTNDGLIPIQHGKMLYRSYKGPKQHVWIPGANHNDVFSSDPDFYLEKLRIFANQMVADSAVDFSHSSRATP